MLTFLHENLAEFLFKGHRVWLWFGYILLYMGLYIGLEPNGMYYVYDPHAAVLIDGMFYPYHLVTNFIKLGVVTGCYGVMCILLTRMAIKTGSSFNANYQVKVNLKLTI
ncbi:hypothetical protein L596_012865 [Steinernema carpocapsae]|uniref:Uncharacterized protein n=1 Tax=Steinernema carpocapsae TaxID=34508 RepID=A0A4U5NYC5_STECR|nr:hypothetical protein L596_012865 [Steinernema carpocapsae]